MACLKQEKQTNIKIFINIYVMFPMVTRVMDYGQQIVRVARYIGQGFIDISQLLKVLIMTHLL